MLALGWQYLVVGKKGTGRKGNSPVPWNSAGVSVSDSEEDHTEKLSVPSSFLKGMIFVFFYR